MSLDLILCEDKIAQTYAIRFNSWETAIIDPFIKHSMPIPLKGTFEFEVWHRSVCVFYSPNLIEQLIR